MADVKWSQLPSATPGNSDEVVGLHSGDNARFTIANIVAAVRNGLANLFVPKTDVGAAGGVASLDSAGKVPSSQLASLVLKTASSFSLPASGSSVSKDMSGLTADHELIRWNFYDNGAIIPENQPPADLTWTTYAGYFTITNNGGTTAATIQPVFAIPSAAAISNH